MGDGRGRDEADPVEASPGDATTRALAAAWPPEDAEVPDAGYRRAGLVGTELVAATGLPGGGAVALARGGAAGGAHGWSLAPVVPLDSGRPLDGGVPGPLERPGVGRGSWRRARAGDGVATGLVRALAEDLPLEGGFELAVGPARPHGWDEPSPGEPTGRERALGTDQTNETVIVGGRTGVKWLLHPDAERERAPRLLRHLTSVGHRETPPLLGILSWRPAPDDPPLTLALVDAWLPGARDGWDWCADAVMTHATPGHRCAAACPARMGAPLGGLVARLHVALATPSAIIPAPVGHADAAAIAGWRASALEALDEALALTLADDAAAGERLRAWRPLLVERLDALASVETTPVQPIHGDLHVGQVLAGPHGLAVIDLDGSPTADAATAQAPAPAARDVAAMLCSLDHVARIVIGRGADVPRAEAWLVTAEDAFLEAYREGLAAEGRAVLLDPRLLAPFRVEQECRDLLYAARFLPRWRYAPMGALCALLEGC